MSKANNLTDFLTGVASAIRAKKGTSALIDPQDFESEIASIEGGGGGGGGELNIAYGLTPPQDTSKLWVKRANEPDKVLVNYGFNGALDAVKLENDLMSYPLNNASCAAVGKKIYLFGGYWGASSSPTNAIRIFDTETRTLTTSTKTLANSIEGTACASVGTKTYIFGGMAYSTYYNTIQVYDTEADTIQTLTSVLPSTLAYMACCAIGTKIYLFGGRYSSSVQVSRAMMFDTETNTITSLTNLPTASWGITCCAVGTKIYLFGGRAGSTYYNTIRIYDTQNDSYSSSSKTLASNVVDARCGSVGNKCYIFGGYVNSTYLYTIQVYDTVGDTIKTLTTSLNSLTSNQIACCTIGIDIYLIGGTNGSIGWNNKVLQIFTAELPLTENYIEVLHTDTSPNPIKIINWNSAEIIINPEAVLLGNSNNVAELIHWAIYDGTNWVDDTGTVTFTKLYPPTIAMSSNDSSQVAITNDSRNGNNVTGYKIYNGDTYITTVTTTPFDLNNVIATAGNYNLCVRAIGTGYDDSNSSNIITFTAYSITNVLSNVSASSSNWHFYFSTISSLISLTYTADTGYSLPSSITVSGATLSAWNSLLGVANITNPTENITITIVGEETSGHSVYVDASDGYLSCSVFDGDIVNDSGNAEYITDFGYSDEDDISPDGTVNITSGYISITCGAEANRITSFSTGGNLGSVYIDSTDTYNNVFVLRVTDDTGRIYLSPECMIKGTLITLADRSVKPIEDITYDDELLVWNFYEGKFDKAKPKWIRKVANAISYNLVKFSNGAEIGFVGMGGNSGYHRIFNKQAGAFTHTGTNDTPNGTITYSHNDEQPIVISQEVIKSPVEYYNIITEKHYNLFANSILTSCKLSNKYYIQDMKYVGKEIISADEEQKYFENIEDKKL